MKMGRPASLSEYAMSTFRGVLVVPSYPPGAVQGSRRPSTTPRSGLDGRLGLSRRAKYWHDGGMAFAD
jgi:hypothetical protein